MDVPSLMRQAMRYNRNRRALVFESRSYTYGEAWQRGVKVANALIAMGIRPGDRVAAVEDNSLAAADLFIGAAIAGAVRVPLYARNSRDSHRSMLGSTGTKVLFADEPYAVGLAGIDGELDGLAHVIVRDARYEDWLQAQSDVDPMTEVGEDDWYVIRHSSGTSGRPKGVGYTQYGWLTNSRNWFIRLPVIGQDTVLAHAAPISHAAGYLFLPVWLTGGTNLLLRGFDVVTLTAAMAEFGVTHTFLAPSMLAALAAHLQESNRSFPRLACLLTGGSPITDATILAGRRIFGDVLYQVYGMTEATPLTIMTPQDWFGDVAGSNPMRSAGRILPYALVEVRDPDGNALPAGEAGEIYCHCEAQMKEYWGDLELSKAKIRDGWIRTGDIGRIDDNGYLYVVDRADDMIVSGGFNIWPAELETIIASHPAVIEVAVFGIPHERWGETPMAVCQVSDPGAICEADVIDLVVSRIGSYMKPTRVEFITDPLPKTLVGKLSRRTLREPHWQGHDRRVGGA